MPVKFLGDELPENAYELLRTKPIDVVIATVDEDGFPRTSPYGLIRALDRKTLRVGFGPGKRMYANIVRDGNARARVSDGLCACLREYCVRDSRTRSGH